jgi:hypothetical protein
VLTSTVMLWVILRRPALGHAGVPAPHLAAVPGLSGPGHQPAWSRPAVLPVGSVLPDAG